MFDFLKGTMAEFPKYYMAEAREIESELNRGNVDPSLFDWKEVDMSGHKLNLEDEQ